MIKPVKFFASPARSILAVSALGLLLAGCGGGGGTPTPTPVTISIGNPVGLGNSPINRLAFPVILSAAANGTLTVNYSTSNESATGGAACVAGGAPDYVSKSNAVLIIPSGQNSGTIEITVCNPAAFAGAAAMKVTLLSSSANGQLASVEKVAYGLVNNLTLGKLNDTGVTLCSDATTQAACPKSGFAGQDGEAGRDASGLSNAEADGSKGFSFAKAATNAGTAEVVSSNTAVWDCVQDNVTGLVWEAKTAINKTDVFTHAQAQTYVATLNGAALCGYTDWRLPTPQELASLVDSSVSFSSATATIDQTFFADQQRTYYWTATGDVGDATGAWVVDFSSGLMAPLAKTLQHGVRLVRGTASASNYQAAVAETVADASTALTWRTCVDGLSGAACASGSATAFTWQQALARVAALNAAGFAGHSDWRLPNRNELLSIVDYTRHNPTIDPAAFPGFPSVGGNALSCWTSTPYAADGVSAKAWFVDFVSGDVGIAPLTSSRHLLLVRG